jgi:hypothetical protein
MGKTATQSVDQLKKEVSKLQSKIEELEGGEKPKKEKPVKGLFRWQSFSRPYRKRNARYLLYLLLIVSTITIILLFAREFTALFPLLALAALAYILVSAPPEIIENSITTQGINSDKHSYIWEELDDFWFVERTGFTILEVNTFLSWPRRLFILINQEDKEKIRDLLARYIPYREIPSTSLMDNLGEQFSKIFHKITS